MSNVHVNMSENFNAPRNLLFFKDSLIQLVSLGKQNLFSFGRHFSPRARFSQLFLQ